MSQKNISDTKKIKKYRIAISSSIFILLFSLIGVGNYAYSPSLKYPLKNHISSIELHEVATGRYLKSLDSLSQSADYASGDHYVRVNFTLKEDLTGHKLYLSAMQAAVRVRENGVLLYELGEFKKGIVPAAQDILVNLAESGETTVISIELIPYSLINTPFNFITASGLDKAGYLNSIIFFKTILTEYGYLALSGIFLVFSFVYSLFLFSMSGKKEIKYLVYACLCQIWTSFYYSRQGYASPLGVYIHHISFVVYFLFAHYYSKFIFSFFNVRGAKLFRLIPFVPLASIAALFYLYANYPLTGFIPYYKDLLLLNLLLNYLPATVIAIRNREQTKYTFMAISGILIVLIGQANDVLRVFALSLAPYNIGPYTFFLANMFFIIVLAFAIVDLFEKNVDYSKLMAIGATTQTLAHDIRKPFSQFKTLLANFNMFKDNPSHLEAAKKEIDRAIKHVEAMLADIIDFSRELKLETQPEAIAPVIDFSIRQAAESAHRSGISFSYDIKNRYKPLIDADRCGRALSNIFSNAIEAITEMGKKSSGNIRVSARDVLCESGTCLELEIANDGPPFSEEDLPRLFGSFFTKGKKKGTGLGLASVHKIVSMHNGTIEARNLPGGKGVTFTLLLPSSADREEGGPYLLPKSTEELFSAEIGQDKSLVEEQVNNLISQKKRFEVILLEDEPLYRAAIKHVVRRSEALEKNLAFYDAHTVDDALKLARDLPITHAIVDIDLNDAKNGFDFLSALKESGSHIACMVHTNRCTPEDRENAKRLGARDFVPKPLNLSHLVQFLTDTQTRPAPGTAPEARPGKIILACDDELLARKCAEKTIKDAAKDATLYMFSGAEALLAKLKELHAGAAAAGYTVYTDQNMNGMTGLELIAAIRGLGIPCRIFMVANELKSEFAEKARKAGADGYYEAPLSGDILAETL